MNLSLEADIIAKNHGLYQLSQLLGRNSKIPLVALKVFPQDVFTPNLVKKEQVVWSLGGGAPFSVPPHLLFRAPP